MDWRRRIPDALGSAVFAALTARFAQAAVTRINSNRATLLRTVVVRAGLFQGTDDCSRGDERGIDHLEIRRAGDWLSESPHGSPGAPEINSTSYERKTYLRNDRLAGY